MPKLSSSSRTPVGSHLNGKRFTPKGSFSFSFSEKSPNRSANEIFLLTSFDNTEECERIFHAKKSSQLNNLQFRNLARHIEDRRVVVEEPSSSLVFFHPGSFGRRVEREMERDCVLALFG